MKNFIYMLLLDLVNIINTLSNVIVAYASRFAPPPPPYIPPVLLKEIEGKVFVKYNSNYSYPLLSFLMDNNIGIFSEKEEIAGWNLRHDSEANTVALDVGFVAKKEAPEFVYSTTLHTSGVYLHTLRRSNPLDLDAMEASKAKSLAYLEKMDAMANAALSAWIKDDGAK